MLEDNFWDLIPGDNKVCGPSGGLFQLAKGKHVCFYDCSHARCGDSPTEVIPLMMNDLICEFPRIRGPSRDPKQQGSY